MTRSFWFSLLAAMVTLLLTVVACNGVGSTATKPVETELPFETVLKFPDGPVSPAGTQEHATYQDLNLIVVTNQAQAQQIADVLSSADYDETAILIVGYDEYLVVIADWGTKPTGGWEVTIEEITQVGRDVQVVVKLVEPTAGDTVVTHPVHAVKVSKTALTTRGALHFVLMDGDKVVLSGEYSIP